jgi:hypothetical protein
MMTTSGSVVSWMTTLPSRRYLRLAIRDDIGVDDLMTIVASMMFALRRRPGPASDPQRAVAVLRDGLLAAPRAAEGESHLGVTA